MDTQKLDSTRETYLVKVVFYAVFRMRNNVQQTIIRKVNHRDLAGVMAILNVRTALISGKISKG